MLFSLSAQDTLFPYARQHVKEFLSSTWESPETQADIQALKEQVTLSRTHSLVYGLLGYFVSIPLVSIQLR